MKIPAKLNGWNYSVIRRLVEDGYMEASRFEFKPGIKDHTPKQQLTHRIRATSCAFANTDGGFIIFGILDEKNAKDRIVGIDKTNELAKEFNDKIKVLDPTIEYNFKNPSIKIPNKPNNVLLVVHILRSNNRPHMNKENGVFYYRSNGGNEFMTYHQVKEEFLRYEERINKLNLLYIEILGNLSLANDLVRTVKKTNIIKINDGDYLLYSTVKFETVLIANLLPEVTNIINDDLVKMILRLRLQMITVNNELEHHLRLDKEEKKFQYNAHRDYIIHNIENLMIPLISNILTALEKYDIKTIDKNFKIFDN